MTITYRDLTAHVYYDDRDHDRKGWYAEYRDSDDVWGDSEKIWATEMPRRRDASRRAAAIARSALVQEYRRRTS